MEEIDRSALVQYSAQQMFDLVNDIEKYPLFMSGCVDARVIRRHETELTGELCLAKAGIKHRLITRNTMCPPQRIDMGLVEGNFKNFRESMAFTGGRL
jgi:ribosome-associated toxin RatA of RatAB toxin-antitoxin module